MKEKLWVSEAVETLKNNIENYIVNEKNIVKEGGQEELESINSKRSCTLHKDRCSFVWEQLYKKCYTSQFWGLINWDEYKVKKSYEILQKKLDCRFSGDVLFSFKSEKDGAKGKGKKYEYYLNKLSNDNELSKEEKSYYLEILSFCNFMNYSLHNMGLMPVDGNLQAIKEGYGDRLDTYIFAINEYYIIEDKEKADLIKKVRTPGGKYPGEVINETDKVKKEKMKDDIKKKRKEQAQSEVLEAFKIFETIAKESGIEDVIDENGDTIKAGTILYCREMYLIDNNDFLARLIKNGSYAIENSSDVVNYMKLAIEYWIMKDEILKSK